MKKDDKRKKADMKFGIGFPKTSVVPKSNYVDTVARGDKEVDLTKVKSKGTPPDLSKVNTKKGEVMELKDGKKKKKNSGIYRDTVDKMYK